MIYIEKGVCFVLGERFDRVCDMRSYKLFDMFSRAGHVETVVLMSK